MPQTNFKCNFYDSNFHDSFVRNLIQKVSSFTLKLYKEEYEMFFWKTKKALCTGVLLNGGYIVTNSHCKEANVAKFINNTAVGIKFLGQHAVNKIDIGILRITDTKYWLDKSAAVFNVNIPKVPDRIYSLGHSCGLGYLFAKFGKITSVQNKTYSSFKHSVVLMPSDSGSPLFDINGKIIGLNHGAHCPQYIPCDNKRLFKISMCESFLQSLASFFKSNPEGKNKQPIIASCSHLGDSLTIPAKYILETIQYISNITKTNISL